MPMLKISETNSEIKLYYQFSCWESHFLGGNKEIGFHNVAIRTNIQVIVKPKAALYFAIHG